VFQAADGVLQFPIPHGRSADHQAAIRHSFGQGGVFCSRPEQRSRADRRTGFAEGHFVGIHHAQLGETKVGHGAGGRTEIDRVAGGHHDHPQVGSQIGGDVPRIAGAARGAFDNLYICNGLTGTPRYNASVERQRPPAFSFGYAHFGESAFMKTEQQTAPSTSFNSVKDVETHIRTKMDKALSDLQHEMASIRTGRASVSILDNIRVDYYGTPTPLNQLANLHVPEPSLITIQPWDVSQIGPIEKAIRVSDLGLNPANDGKVIRLPIPPLTEERRKELVKKLHGAAEHHRVSVRNVRRDGNEAIKKLLKDKKITEDEDKRAHDEIQKLTDGYMGKIDLAAKTKEKEILEIK